MRQEIKQQNVLILSASVCAVLRQQSPAPLCDGTMATLPFLALAALLIILVILWCFLRPKKITADHNQKNGSR